MISSKIALKLALRKKTLDQLEGHEQWKPGTNAMMIKKKSEISNYNSYHRAAKVRKDSNEKARTIPGVYVVDFDPLIFHKLILSHKSH